MNMKKYKFLSLWVACIFCLNACTEYLAVVPDNTLKLENLFSMKEDAYEALAKVYSYLPLDDKVHDTMWELGDEWVGPQIASFADNIGNLHGIRIMRGLQSATLPQLGSWNGTNGSTHLYQGIRAANVFLENINSVHNMTPTDIADWSAQVKFLKAYFHFLLLQKYGPIIISDAAISPDALSEELFQSRNKVEEVFDYIINLMEEAIPDLRDIAPDIEAGMVDKIAAKGILARVKLFRASPFYNGNREYFGDFYDHDGQPFFSMESDGEKWKEALDASDEAVSFAEGQGKKPFEFAGSPFLYDTAAFRLNAEQMKYIYNCRMLICTPWNSELVWGLSNILFYSDGAIHNASNIRLPDGYGDGEKNLASYSWNWFGASYAMTERYYTANGLPIDEDNTFDMTTMHNITVTPGVDEPEYVKLQGVMQPGAETVNLYLGREPRFYANMGITGGFWRAHLVRINTTFFNNDPMGAGKSSYSGTNDYLSTGIGVQKFVHPENMSAAWQRQIPYPYPIIRLADLYLMRAEARNEYEGPSQKVYDDLNKVRRRAGVPDVEKVWADAALCKHPGQHLTQDGLREIILRERAIELAFEGNRFWDMLRYKRAPQEFSTPITGWNYNGDKAADFFTFTTIEQRRFSIQDCLWPISLDETNTNGKLIQNPGW